MIYVHSTIVREGYLIKILLLNYPRTEILVHLRQKTKNFFQSSQRGSAFNEYNSTFCVILKKMTMIIFGKRSRAEYLCIFNAIQASVASNCRTSTTM